MEKVYDLYKKDRNVTGKARFDSAIDVTGDKTPEREGVRAVLVAQVVAHGGAHVEVGRRV